MVGSISNGSFRLVPGLVAGVALAAFLLGLATAVEAQQRRYPLAKFARLDPE